MWLSIESWLVIVLDPLSHDLGTLSVDLLVTRQELLHPLAPRGQVLEGAHVEGGGGDEGGVGGEEADVGHGEVGGAGDEAGLGEGVVGPGEGLRHAGLGHGRVGLREGGDGGVVLRVDEEGKGTLFCFL